MSGVKRCSDWSSLALILAAGLVALTVAPGFSLAQGQSRITVAMGVDPRSLDPLLDATMSTVNILLNVFDYLVFMNDRLEVEPSLAESWKQISSTLWEFKLRKGVKFHDGSEVTAEDVKFSMDRVTDTKTGSVYSSHMRSVVATTPVDRYTVRIRTNPAFAPLLRYLTWYGPIMSKAAFERMGAGRLGQAPVGSGPYRFVEWVKNDRVVLEANDQYWGGKPKVQRVIFRTIPDEFTRAAELKTAGVDIATNLFPSRAAELRNDPSVTVANVRSLRVLILGMNMNVKPLDDLRVRRALNHAVNVDELINAVLHGNAYRNPSPVPGLSFGHTDDVTKYEYNPQKARQLLAEAGVPPGTTIVFEAPRARYLADKEIAEAVAGYLEAVGLKVELRLQEWGAFLPRYLGGRMDGLYIYGCGDANADANTCLDVHFHTESRGLWYGQGYRDLDAMLTLGRSAMDPEVRKSIYARAQKAITDRAPWIFLFDYRDIYGVRRGVKWTPRSDERILLRQVEVGSR